MRNNFEDVSSLLLDAFEDTPRQALKDWWVMKKLCGESYEEYAIRLETELKRGLTGCDSVS